MVEALDKLNNADTIQDKVDQRKNDNNMKPLSYSGDIKLRQSDRLSMKR